MERYWKEVFIVWAGGVKVVGFIGCSSVYKYGEGVGFKSRNQPEWISNI